MDLLRCPTSPVSTDRSRTFWILLALWLLMFSSSSQVIIVSPILPEISAALNVPAALQGWLVSIYAVMLCIFALLTGPVSDRVGRQRILLAGTAAMAGALWLHGLARSFEALLLMRALAGSAGGMLSGGVVAYIGDYFPYQRRGWANGWAMSGMAAGQILGIPAGKILADNFGFRWPFLVFAATMTLTVLIVWRRVPQPDVERDERRLTFSRAFRGYARLFRIGTVRAATAAYFLMFCAVGLFVIYLPTWLEDVVGLTGTQVALLFFFGGLATVVAGPTAGWVSDHTGRRPLIIASCLTLGALMLATTYVIAGMASAALLYALAMTALALRIAPMQALMTALVPGARRGVLMSLAVGIGQIGIGLGGVLAGAAYAAFGYGSNTVLGAASMGAMAWVVWRHLPEPEKTTPATPAERVPSASDSSGVVMP